ncbi:MAG TPA: helix-turn-helix transcriptional regulator [Candidatus Limnocylindrales bacterium]
MGETNLQRSIRERRRALRRAIGAGLRKIRLEAGLSIREVAAAAELDWSHLARVEAGERDLSLAALVAVTAVLGHDPSIRFYPSSGPRVHDRHQVRMIEALLAVAHPRWTARLEVPVYRPVHGVIDVVLQDPQAGEIVAGEAHSLLQTVDAQIRWATQKAEALPSAHGWPWTPLYSATPRLSRLLVLRSTEAMRGLVRSLPETFRVAYPARPTDAFRALTQPGVEWPGPAILWVDLDGRATTVLHGPPRGIGI